MFDRMFDRFAQALTPIWEESFWRVSRSASLSEKNEFAFLTKFGILML